VARRGCDILVTSARGGRIVLLTGSSLCHNPRVFKAAGALARAGHDVQVLGAWLDPDLKARDLPLIADAPFRFVPVLDSTLPGLHAAMAQLFRRALRKAVNARHAMTGLESPHQLGIAVKPMLAHAQKIAADLFIAHSESALHVAWTLMKRGKRAGVDMEDWFSEDLLPESRRRRPLRLLRFLEQELLVRGAFASCPSRVMSQALAKEYGGKPPIVLYNAFPWADRNAIDGRCKDRRNSGIASIYWYSQTIGPGRGIEDLVGAMPSLKCEVEIHLRGRVIPGMANWIMSRIPERLRQRVFFHPLVANDELLSRIAEHDIGFAGEMQYCRSRDLTVTNKILHYLLGGLAVVASDTAGQREVAAQTNGAVELYRSGSPQALAKTLDSLIAAPDRLQRAKAGALQAAEMTFCWQRQEGTLVKAVAAALMAGRDALKGATATANPDP
jgi:glycosyltransferase involved in cell wall biosynthesis